MFKSFTSSSLLLSKISALHNIISRLISGKSERGIVVYFIRKLATSRTDMHEQPPPNI